MALDNYTDLQASMLNWLARAGDPFLAAVAPDAITAFETEIVVRLRTMDMELSATLTIAPTVSLPTGYLEGRFMNMVGARQWPINYVTPSELAANYGSGCFRVNVYSIANGNILFPPAGWDGATNYDAESTTAQFDYYGFTGLAASESGTNWLLQKYPKAYLFGGLTELCTFSEDLRQGGRADWFKSERDRIISEIESADNRAKHPGQLAMRPRGWTP